MTEVAIDCRFIPFSTSQDNPTGCEEGAVDRVPSVVQKPEQHSELRLKSVLSSQLTQEHSGISYALKAHLLIVAFERIRTRKLAKAYATLTTPANPHAHALAPSELPLPSRIITSSPHKDASPQQEPQTPSNSQTGANWKQFPLLGFLQCSPQKSSAKFLTRERFQSHLKARELQWRCGVLAGELADAQRRQERETLKKRESLASLAEELGEKNEVIEELKTLVRGLRNRLNLKQHAMVLEEDAETLRRDLLHLEGVNDRLNDDLARARQGERALADQLKALAAENERLRAEIGRLREEGFEVDASRQQLEIGRRECAVWERRLRARQERVAVVERRVNEIGRNKGGQSDRCIAFCTERRLESTPNVVSCSQTQRELDLTSKIEAIFEFFFHIDDQAYSLHFSELFDSEEREFLQAQKLKLAHLAQDTSRLSPVKEREEREKNGTEFGCSVLELIERESQKPVDASVRREEGWAKQAAEVKEKLLFVRSVLLSFLRSLELRGLKKESENILELLYDCFEYSEAERNSLFPPRRAKLFGLI